MNTLIEQYFSGTITRQGKEELFSAMENDPALRDEFAAMKEALAIAASAPREGDDEASREALSHFHLLRKTREHRFAIRRIAWYTSAAAVIIAGVIFAFAHKEISHEGQTAEGTTAVSVEERSVVIQNSIAFTEVFTEAGEVKEITLGDGTKVWLNGSTVLRYPRSFNHSERHVELLEGEAFFDVTHNEKLPFVVTSKGYDIRVLGTKFNVLAYPSSNFKASLVEGSIELMPSRKKEDAVKIIPNQSAEAVDGKIVTELMTTHDELLWKDGIMVFRNARFSEIAEKFHVYYGVSFDIEDEDLSYRRFSGKFRRSDGPEVALNAIRKALGFEYGYNAGTKTYTIRK